MIRVVPGGKIYRRKKDGAVVVEFINEPWSLEQEGVTCINPDVPEKERIYQKIFHNKPIFLPDQYKQAVQETIFYPDNFIISMNGYSQLTEKHCREYGIQQGAYEEACAGILRAVIEHLRLKFHSAQLRLIYGASDFGVDKAIESVAVEFNIPLLGFSCPRFMLYVKDDKIPVFVASNVGEYSDLYISTLDLLIATGGRKHALQHDTYAACIYGKRIHFVDVLSYLSKTGGVPATKIEPDGSVTIDNAAAAFGRNISFYDQDELKARIPSGSDEWDRILNNVQSVATKVCRDKMSPERKFR